MHKYLLAALGMFLAAPAFAQVTATGTGTVYAKPDMATLQFSVVTEGKLASQATDANRQAAAKLFDTLKRLGVDEKDVSSATLHLSPKYDRDGNNVLGFTATHVVVVKVRKLADAGKVIDGAAQGEAHLTNMRFGVSNRDELEQEARAKALANALLKATQMVRRLDEQLGHLKSVSETGYHSPIRSFRALSSAAPEGAAPTQLAAGEQEIVVTVTASWDVAGPNSKPKRPKAETEGK